MTERTSGITADFVERDATRLFRVCFASAAPRYRVLVVPAFAEEMNRCRPLLARTARALAATGCVVLLPDLSGTGDSGGEFGEARWSAWRDELHTHCANLAVVWPNTEPAILAVRSGALLLDATLTRDARVVCWQAVTNGERFLQQQLRIRVMAEKFAGREESVKALQARLQAGECIEVGGYALTTELGAGLVGARLETDTFAACASLDLLEFRIGGGGEVSAPARRLVDSLVATGVAATAQVIEAEPFWSTQEIALPTTVSAATVALFERGTTG